MSSLKLDSIAVDCPDPDALAAFYADFLGVEADGDSIHLNDGKLNVWFQQVEDYAPPTWPTQERGQQLHFDFAVKDVSAAIRRAEELGATQPEHQPGGDDWSVMLDPVGHPFCICSLSDDADTSAVKDPAAPVLTAINVDCADISTLADFYQNLIGGTVQHHGEWTALVRENELSLYLQVADDYKPPTWPTQERGQQIHYDFHTQNREAEVERALSLGATKQVERKGFTVMTDPAGHPFCICTPEECEIGK